MAKDNLFLGMGRGAVGDVVFSRLNGQQVARARNRHPRNPQTPLQLIQRICMATVGKAYSFFSPLCDHSFEGAQGPQGSQLQFTIENTRLLRDKLADLIAYPTDRRCEDSEVMSYSFAGDTNPCFNEYLLSKGSLPTLELKNNGTEQSPYYRPALLLNTSTQPTLTTTSYQDICDMLGLLPGDQITTVNVYVDTNGFDDTFVSLQYARVILMPNDGDMSKPFCNSAGINAANERNIGTMGAIHPVIDTSDDTPTKYYLNIGYDTMLPNLFRMGACAIILSRQDGSGWLRSTQFLKPAWDVSEHFIDHPFGMAYVSHKNAISSDLYLNQAQRV